MIERPEYLKFLINWKDKQIIKVITGVRRCGKSTLFDLYINYLKKTGINDNQIIKINFEDPDFEDLCNYKALYSYLKTKLVSNKMTYIFLDEIQNVSQFEKAIDGLLIKPNVDIYITGSNSKLMSSDISTLLSGRYVELKMFPLSFKEYASIFDKNISKEELYNSYIYNGSFPYIANLNSREKVYSYLDGLYNTIIVKDISERNNIIDSSKFKSFIMYMFSNIGNLISAKKVADTMTSMNRKISPPTIENYIEGITTSYLMYEAKRYDIKGKEYLKFLNKYYLVDIGLRFYLLGNKNVDLGYILENIVYIELLRRGYKVYVGKLDNYEVDFICEDMNGNTEYYQVALTTRDENILKREINSLDKIPDHNPKYLLTMDNDPIISYNGIKKIYVIDWLLK